MSTLILGVRFLKNNFQRIRVDNINFDSKIEQFKLEVSNKANLPKDGFELVYCGKILDDEASINSCGLKHGAMVHVLKKKPQEAPRPVQTVTEADIQTIVIAFRALTRISMYRNALQKLSRPDILDNIIAVTPGLSQDPVAISMIQDPELLVRMGDADTVRRIVELHPALAEAANHIVAAVHENALFTGNHGNQPATSSGYSYSLEALSDDEEMDSSQSSDSQPQGLSRQASYSTITAAHLAAAIASASGAGSSSSGSGETPPITSEMFNQAMQRALSSTSSPTSQEPSAAAAAAADASAAVGSGGSMNLERQMQQMRELGLTDDALNLHVLQLTGGNVHDAIDLVFSGTAPPP